MKMLQYICVMSKRIYYPCIPAENKRNGKVKNFNLLTNSKLTSYFCLTAVLRMCSSTNILNKLKSANPAIYHEEIIGITIND